MSLSPTQFQTWQGDRYAYEIIEPQKGSPESSGSLAEAPALLLVHPIGVGLSRRFWDRFNAVWSQRSGAPIYNPDLMGCGDSDLPQRPYSPDDRGQQLQNFLHEVIQRPVVVIAQGALAPAAIALCALEKERIDAGTSHLKGMILSAPPAWRLMVETPPIWKKNLAWRLFCSPLGAPFYRYARRRKFLESFSRKQLFASQSPITDDWIEPLVAASREMATRHAVFAFLSRFWQAGFEEAVAAIQLPTLVVFGDEASSVTRSGNSESASDRVAAYTAAFPDAVGEIIPGRNVLPFESTHDFVQVIQSFIEKL